ncbi:MAG: ABC transporter substrate-binding protein [Natronospirillum sp.]
MRHAALATLAAAVMGVTATAQAEKFVVAVPQEPQDLAAQGIYKEVNAPGLRNVIEPLIMADSQTGEYLPVLATDWEWIDDRSMRITIRQGVTFHDGSPMTAEAVAHAIEFVWDRDNSFTIQEYAGPGLITAEVEDENTVIIHSSEPDPMLDFRLTLTGVTSQQQIQDDPSAHYTHPTGTGPYQFDHWDRGSSWSATRNTDWWGWDADDVYGKTLPTFDELEFQFRTESSSRMAMMMADEADIVISPQSADCERASRYDDFNCVTGPSDQYLYGRLDHSLYADERLQDPRVRAAIFHSISYEGISQILGLASVPQGQLGTPDMTGFNDELEQYRYDPQYAMQLLDEARADGVDVDSLQVEIMGRTDTPRIGELIEAIGAMVGSTGIKTLQNVQTPAVANPRFRVGSYQDEAPRALMQVHVKQNPSPDFGLNLLSNYACPDTADPSGPTRSSVFCDESFDERLAQSLTLTGEARHEAMKELNAFLHERYLTAPLAILDRAYLLKDEYDFVFGPAGRFLLVNVVSAE